MFHFIHRNVKKLFYEVARGFKSFVLVLSGKAGIFLKMVRTKVHWYILTLCLLRVIRTFISPKHFGTLSKRNWTRIQKNFQIGYFFRIQHQILRPSKPCLRMHGCGLNFQEFLERGYWIDMWSLSSLLISHIGSLWSSNLWKFYGNLCNLYSLSSLCRLFNWHQLLSKQHRCPSETLLTGKAPREFCYWCGCARRENRWLYSSHRLWLHGRRIL